MTLQPDASPDPDFLERGADSVLLGTPTEPLRPDEMMLRQALDALIRDLRAAMAGLRLDPVAFSHVDRLDLLRRLRREVLEGWAGGDHSLLEVMRAFEATEQALISIQDTRHGDAVGPFPRSLLREVGHLLRSPLGSVVMLTGALLEERSGPLTAAQRRRVEIVHRAAESAAASAGDLLTLTSPYEYVGDTQPFSVAQIVGEVADLVEAVTESQHSELIVHQGVEEIRMGSAVAVRQALFGVAVRAALMTRDGTLEVAASSASGDAVEFTVTSTPGGDAAAAADDPLRLLRTDPGSEAYTIAPEGLAFQAVQGVVRSLGSELEVDATSGSLVLRYRLVLPFV